MEDKKHVEKNVLIVEDDAIIAMDIESRLKNIGYTVVRRHIA